MTAFPGSTQNSRPYGSLPHCRVSRLQPLLIQKKSHPKESNKKLPKNSESPHLKNGGLEYDEISLLGGSLPNFQGASLLLFSQSVEPCKQQHFPIVHLGCVSGDFLLSTMDNYQ